MEELVDTLATKLYDDVYLDFSEEELHEARSDLEGSVLVKLVGGRGFKKRIFISIFKKLWGQRGSVTFSEVEDNILLAKFSSDEDRERALNNGPWLHLGWVVLITRWKTGKSLDEIFDEKIHLTVQIHNLPLEMKTEAIARKCAAVAGRVVECFPACQNSNLNMLSRKFYRLKVEVDLTKPLQPGCFVSRKGENSIKIIFIYQKLPNICFRCGLFDHETTRCCNKERMSRIKYDKMIRVEYNTEWELSSMERKNQIGDMKKRTIGITPAVTSELEKSEETEGSERAPVDIPDGQDGQRLGSVTDGNINYQEDHMLFQENMDLEDNSKEGKNDEGKEMQTNFNHNGPPTDPLKFYTIGKERQVFAPIHFNFFNLSSASASPDPNCKRSPIVFKNNLPALMKKRKRNKKVNKNMDMIRERLIEVTEFFIPPTPCVEAVYFV